MYVIVEWTIYRFLQKKFIYIKKNLKNIYVCPSSESAMRVGPVSVTDYVCYGVMDYVCYSGMDYIQIFTKKNLYKKI